jgi:hypothetical protein
MPEESKEPPISDPYDVLPHFKTNNEPSLTPSSLSPKNPHHGEEQGNTSHRGDLLQRLLVNLFLAQPRKGHLSETEEQSIGEEIHEQK